VQIVEVKEKDGTKKKLQPCVFCEEGTIKCDACEGTGKDIALGSGALLPPLLSLTSAWRALLEW
jgi:hypothetical protein